jgi:hypothetical protein
MPYNPRQVLPVLNILKTTLLFIRPVCRGYTTGS